MMNNEFYIDSYFRKLIPFYVVSILLHVVFLGGSVAYSTILNKGGGPTSAMVYPTNPDAKITEQSGKPGQSNQVSEPTRKRIFKINYFNTVKLEIPIIEKPKISAILKPEIKKPADQKPVTDPNRIEKPVPDRSGNPDEESNIPSGFIWTEDELSKEPLVFPSYRFDHIPYNPDNWDIFYSTWCYRYDVVYFMADISKKNGFEEYFEWAKFWDYLLTLEGAANPPTPIGIAEMIQDPYYLTSDLAVDSMTRRLEKLEYKNPDHKKYNFIDVDGQVIKALGIEDLERPVVFLVDYEGYVRLKLEGNLVDIPLDQVRKALAVIKQQWGMNDIEVGFATAAIVTYQQDLIKEKAKEKKTR
jgi:hypothetical protein